MSVDLVDRKVTAPDGTPYEFSVDETRRERMLKGLDDVGVTLEHLPRIEAFEHEYYGRRPWLPQKR
jgi:3-isopropylmalate/(R)-2-methylmalate dehydratase small subunit